MKSQTDRLLGLGQFPPYWKDKAIFLLEPHYDDAILSCYGVLMGMLKRKTVNKPNSLAVISVSHSEANYQPGTRLVLGKKDTRNIRLVELGFPDIINNKKFKEDFKAKYKKDYQDVDDQAIYDWYAPNGGGLFGILQAMLRYERTKGKPVIILAPLSDYYSHPMHRLVGSVAFSLCSEEQTPLWLYRDNPYARQNNGKHLPDPWRIVLDGPDVAMRYSLFSTNFDKQVTSQCLWYDYWMLDEYSDYLYEVNL